MQWHRHWLGLGDRTRTSLNHSIIQKNKNKKLITHVASNEFIIFAIKILMYNSSRTPRQKKKKKRKI
jgi:hypothetical protein